MLWQNKKCIDFNHIYFWKKILPYIIECFTLQIHFIFFMFSTCLVKNVWLMMFLPRRKPLLTTNGSMQVLIKTRFFPESSGWPKTSTNTKDSFNTDSPFCRLLFFYCCIRLGIREVHPDYHKNKGKGFFQVK